MDVAAIRRFVYEHPQGVVIRMIDGTEYQIPHRDWVWFTPAIRPDEEKPSNPSKTSFYIAFEGYPKMINALLVKEVYPMQRNESPAA
ncbi:MAG TPA: hypothetical protein VD997_04965 [Phycisphaerales bacterium]|nr:hypothetical protein [Phycisphaerales bacterium]